MYVCLHVCMYVCIYVRMYVPMYVCMYVGMCMSTYVCMYVLFMYICIIYVCMYVDKHDGMCLCIYVCVYISYPEPYQTSPRPPSHAMNINFNTILSSMPSSSKCNFPFCFPTRTLYERLVSSPHTCHILRLCHLSLCDHPNRDLDTHFAFSCTA